MFEAVWWLAQPSSVLLLLVLLAFLSLAAEWRGAAALCVFLAVSVLVGLLFLPVEEWVAAELEERVEPPAALPSEIDGIIVLGGAVDWRVTRERGMLAVGGSAERVIAAEALLERYPGARLVLTGLFDDHVPHDFQREPTPQSLLSGDEFGTVTYIGDARSTYEEALRSLAVVEPEAGDTWILVTSALHMPRALGTFTTQGWSVVPYPVDYRTTGSADVRFRPDLGATLASLDRVVRERGALWIYRRTGRIASEP